MGFETEEELLKEELLLAFLAGNQECTEKLIRAYQDEIVKAAKKLNREDIFWRFTSGRKYGAFDSFGTSF